MTVFLDFGLLYLTSNNKQAVLPYYMRSTKVTVESLIDFFHFFKLYKVIHSIITLSSIASYT